MKTTFTLEEAVENHRKLWREIARILREEDVGKLREIENIYSSSYSSSYISFILTNEIKKQAMKNVFGMNNCFQNLINECFLCEYTDYNCELCPLQEQNRYNSACLNGKFHLFTRLIFKKSYKKASDLASEIAELPIVNVVKTIKTEKEG